MLLPFFPRLSGVGPTSSRRQFASGRSGPAAGRWAVGRRGGTRQAPGTSRRGRSRAGPGRSGGGRVGAPAAPSEPVLGKETALSRESRQSSWSGGGAASGPARPCQCLGHKAPGGARREDRLRTAGGERG